MKKIYFLLPPLLIIIFNVLVNPFDQWNIPRIEGINKHITETERDLLIKPYQIRHKNYSTIILGSSLAAISIPHNHSLFKNKHVYNFGLSGAGTHIQKRALEHAIATNDVDTAFITLGFVGFNAYWTLNQLDENNLSYLINPFISSGAPAYTPILQNLNDTMHNTIGWRGTNASFRTLIRQKRNTTHMDRQGFWLSLGVNKNYVKEYNRTERTALTRHLFPQPKKIFSFKSKTKNDSTFDDFKAMLDLCYANNINTTFIILPMPARGLLSLKYLNLNDDYALWLKNLTLANHLVAESHKSKPFDLWNFQQVNPILNTDKLEDLKPFFYEVFHPTPLTGKQVLNRIENDCKNKACWPGSKIHMENIDNQLAQLQTQLNEFEALNPKQTKELRNNIQKTKKYRLTTP